MPWYINYSSLSLIFIIDQKKESASVNKYLDLLRKYDKSDTKITELGACWRLKNQKYSFNILILNNFT